MMLGSLMNVTAARTTRMPAAVKVIPISTLALPWIWVATGCLCARNLQIE